MLCPGKIKTTSRIGNPTSNPATIYIYRILVGLGPTSKITDTGWWCKWWVTNSINLKLPAKLSYLSIPYRHLTMIRGSLRVVPR